MLTRSPSWKPCTPHSALLCSPTRLLTPFEAATAQSGSHRAAGSGPSRPQHGRCIVSSAVRNAQYHQQAPSKPAASQQQQQQQRHPQQPTTAPLLQQRQPVQQQPKQSKAKQRLQPDPTADDLDLLAAAAATRPSADAGFSSSSAVSPPPTTTSDAADPAAAMAAPIGTIINLPDAQPRYVLPAGRRPRYTAHDKLQLSGEEMRDIGRRLRRATSGAGSVLRVFRYGIDDFRLYKAIDVAGLEGRVVVVDTTAEADAVLTTYSKRTGRNVNLATAKRAAAGAKVPLLILPAVSAQRLVEAVGPLLGLPVAEEDDSAAATSSVRGVEPRMLQWDELEGDGSEELLQLMWGVDSGASSAQQQGAGTADAAAAAAAAAGACCPTPRWHAWCAAQKASPAGAAAVFDAVRSADVEDAREGDVPANPNARAGERHRLLKPMRPFSRVKRRRLRQDLALRNVPW